jgi:hypothetical protein
VNKPQYTGLQFDYEQTPEPWFVGGSDLCYVRSHPQTITGGTPIASFFQRCNNDEQGDSEHASEYGVRIGQINASRCVDCVNALTGIPNPAEFVRAARELARCVSDAAKANDMTFVVTGRQILGEEIRKDFEQALSAFRAAGGAK